MAEGDVQNPQKGHQSQPLPNKPGSMIPNSNPKKLSEVMNKNQPGLSILGTRLAIKHNSSPLSHCDCEKALGQTFVPSEPQNGYRCSSH